MNRLTVDLDPATVRRLSDRARRHGRSLADEAREMLARDVAARGPIEGEAPDAADLAAGFERFRQSRPDAAPSLAALRRARDAARGG